MDSRFPRPARPPRPASWLAPLLALGFGLGAAETRAPAAAEAPAPVIGQPGKDVIWVPTPDAVVQAMLDLAALRPSELVVDLGSGDGKIAIAAALRGARALGIEYNAAMVELSRRNAQVAGAAGARFVQGDIFEAEFSAADVVTLYLLPALNQRLQPRLLQLKPGTRIASHQYRIGDWEPDRVEPVGSRQALLWVVPAPLGGRWAGRIDGGEAVEIELEFEQRFQRLDGSRGRIGAGALEPLADAALDGRRLRFALAGAGGAPWRFEAEAAADGELHGRVVDTAGRQRAFSAMRQPEPAR